VPYLLRLSAGLAVFAAGLTAVEYALFHLMEAGVCLSRTSDFVVDVGCFDKAGTWYRTIPAGLGVAFLGLLLFGGRGLPDDAPGTGARKLSMGVVAWSGGFLATATMLILAAAGPNPLDTQWAKRAALAAAIVMVPFGLVPLVRELRSLAAARPTPGPEPWAPAEPAPEPAWTPTAAPPRAQAPPPSAPPQPQAPPPAPAGSPAIERLNALARQRDSGAISSEEFERGKAEILADMSRGL
jgi:putative oligomerization/nucleic acid binding protein